MYRFADINKVFTDKVAEYLAKGFMINGGTMSDSQGEIAKVDVTNGSEVYRIMVISKYNILGGDRIDVLVGLAKKEVKPNGGYWICGPSIWNRELKIVEEVSFWEIDRRKDVYGTFEEFRKAESKRKNRYRSKIYRENIRWIKSDNAIDIAVRFLKRKHGVKRVMRGKINIGKRDGKYFVNYNGKYYGIA